MEIPIDYQIASYIYKSFTICFLLVGTCTNMLSAIVYSKKRMRKSSYSIYLFSLAIVDLLVTVNGNIRLLLMSYDIPALKSEHYELSSQLQPESLQHIFKGIDIRLTSLAACKIHRFSTYLLMELSSVILSILSIDRFFGCVLVLKSARFCKPSIAARVILITVITLVVFNLHFLVFMGYEIEHELAGLNRTVTLVVCMPNPKNSTYMRLWQIYFYLDSAFYSILPFIIMLFCNISIITKIVKSRVRSKQVIAKFLL